MRPSGILVLAATLLASQGRAAESVSTITTNAPVLMRHVEGTNFGASLSGDKVFFCTNQSSQIILLSSPTVEINSGANWITNSGPYLQAIRFIVAGTNTTLLEAHQVGYCIIRFASPGRPPHPPGLNYLTAPPPAGTVWRIRAQVQNKLTGIADTSARLKMSADQLKKNPRGNAGIPLDKIWSQRGTAYSIPIATVITDEIVAPSL